MIKSPPWYKAQAIGQDGVTSDYYAESMIGADSYGTINSNAGQLTVFKTAFDDTNNQLTLSYKANRDLLSTDNLVVSLTSFHNPVNQNQVRGFQVNTYDSLGFLIDQSEAGLPLLT